MFYKYCERKIKSQDLTLTNPTGQLSLGTESYKTTALPPLPKQMAAGTEGHTPPQRPPTHSVHKEIPRGSQTLSESTSPQKLTLKQSSAESHPINVRQPLIFTGTGQRQDYKSPLAHPEKCMDSSSLNSGSHWPR